MFLASKKAFPAFLSLKDLLSIVGAFALSVFVFLCPVLGASNLWTCLLSVLALACLSAVVGQATDVLGGRIGAGGLGLLQATLGNLPELFFGFFALRAGLILVVQSALVGSILGNSLVVLGGALIVGGWKKEDFSFSPRAPRMLSVLILLADAALVMPTLTSWLHTPASAHPIALSLLCAIVLIGIFFLSLPYLLKQGKQEMLPQTDTSWPLWFAMVVLALAVLASAVVSDHFVSVLTPTIAIYHLSPTFVGLVIVSLAGNAVEHFVALQFAARGKADFAISISLTSALQVALFTTPLLVLLSLVIGVHLTLILPMLFVAALVLANLLVLVILFDGESNYVEGAILVGLYAIIAASFWWG